MLEAYFDDTGTDLASPFVGWGGYVGTTEQWQALIRDWVGILAAPQPGRPPLKYFSIGECARHDAGSAFAEYSQAESDNLRFRIRQAIQESGVIGRFYAVDRTAFDRLVTGAAREFFREPQLMPFAECIAASIAVARSNFPDESELGICFDRGQRSEAYDEVFRLALDRYQEAGRSPNVTLPCWGAVKSLVGLQAADTIATESFWGLKRAQSGADPLADPHFQSFLSRISAEGFVMEEAEIMSTLTRHGF